MIGKPGCHLCEQARAVIEHVAGDLGIAWVERSILEDEALFTLYAEKIPVTLIDGIVHDIYRVDEARLRAALA